MNFRESLRYEYPLCNDSLVVDVGAHKGTFAREIIRRYDCKVICYEPIKAFFNELTKVKGKVRLIHSALGCFEGEEKLGVKGDMSGAFAPDTEIEFVEMRSIIGEAQQWGPVDLLKLNVEGMEFQLLEAIIQNGIQNQFTDIQVQFHPIVPDFQERYDAIRAALLMTHRLTWCFPWVWENYSKLFQSYSQCGQDKFVYALLGEGPDTFLDIGSGHPVENNNTAALERIGWTGWRIDTIADGNAHTWRTSPYIQEDATRFKWHLPPLIGYLSLDIDSGTVDALKNLPLTTTRFKVITIEHDSYRFGDGPRQEMRKILSDHGYDLICADVTNQRAKFEDWWIDPKVVTNANPFHCSAKEWSEIV